METREVFESENEPIEGSEENPPNTDSNTNSPPFYNYEEKMILQTIQSLRETLIKPLEPIINTVLSCGMLSHVLNGMSHNNQRIQCEATYVLERITTGTSAQVDTVIDAGAIPILLDIISKPDLKAFQPAIWTLGNICGDRPENCDKCIQQGIMPIINRLINSDVDSAVRCQISWFMMSMCIHKNQTNIEENFRLLLPPLFSLVFDEESTVLVNTLSAISYLVESGERTIQLICDSGLGQQVLYLLEDEEAEVQSAALRTVQTMMKETDTQMQYFIDHNIISYLSPLIIHQVEELSEDALSLLTHICSSFEEHIEALIQSGIVRMVINRLRYGNFNMKSNAALIILHITITGEMYFLEYIVRHGAIRPLCRLLKCNQTLTIQVVLRGLNHLLAFSGGNLALWSMRMEEYGALEDIEALLNHQDRFVRILSHFLLDNFFDFTEQSVIDDDY